jgi:hypothetical protein
MATRGGRGRGRGRGVPLNPPPPLPPNTMEQLMAMQGRLMQTMMQHIQNQPAGGPPPVHVRDKRAEFLKSSSIHSCY